MTKFHTDFLSNHFKKSNVMVQPNVEEFPSCLFLPVVDPFCACPYLKQLSYISMVHDHFDFFARHPKGTIAKNMARSCTIVI